VDNFLPILAAASSAWAWGVTNYKWFTWWENRDAFSPQFIPKSSGSPAWDGVWWHKQWIRTDTPGW